MKWWKWFVAEGDGPFDMLIGVAALMVVGVVGLIAYGIGYAMVHGYWTPFAYAIGIFVFLLLCLSVGHVVRDFFHDTVHHHSERG